jgi:hypothetical protein
MIRRLCLFVIAVRHKLHHRYVLSAMFGVSGPIVAITCFLLININDWSPEDAQRPVTANPTAYYADLWPRATSQQELLSSDCSCLPCRIASGWAVRNVRR